METAVPEPPERGDAKRLNIVHCLRAPVGGQFRHVRDLARTQQAAGHRVGMICDSTSGGEFEADILESLAPTLSLGLLRIPMQRGIGPSDLAATWRIRRRVRQLDPDVLHGHGAKGGAHARIIGTLLRATGKRVARIYTPHGGSLHFDERSRAGRVYFAVERLLARLTDAFVFVSRYEAATFAAKVEEPKRPAVVVCNGLGPRDFEDVAPTPGAADFLFIGTLRDLKGPDVLIEALARLAEIRGQPAIAVIVGDGPDSSRYEMRVRELGLADAVTFRGPMAARAAFALGRILVVPSRAESMPYVVLEALAAGAPVVATRVGGIPEIFGEFSDRLVTAGDPEALADRMAEVLADEGAAHREAAALRERLGRTFTLAAMAEGAETAYRQAMAR